MTRLETIVTELPTCLPCGSLRLRVKRTIPQGDGSRLRYVRCLDCGWRGKWVAEPPENYSGPCAKLETLADSHGRIERDG